NVRLLRSRLRADVKVCAMVKANAYGHDAALVADALCNFSGSGGQEAPAVDMLGVATIDEAAALPDVDVPVMVLQPVENSFLGQQRARVELAIRNGWH